MTDLSALKLSRKFRIRFKSRTNDIIHRYNHDFPLRRTVTCGHCRKPYTASWNKGRTKRYANYSCTTPGCIYRYKAVGKQKVESEFSILLQNVKPAKEVVDLTRIIFRDVWKKKSADFQVDNQQIASRIQEIDLLVSSLSLRVAKATNETIIASHEAEIVKFQKEKEELESKVINNPYTSEKFGTDCSAVLDTIKHPDVMWQSDKSEQKKVIVSMYFEGKIPYDYHEGFGTAPLAYPIELMNDKNRLNGHYVDSLRKNTD